MIPQDVPEVLCLLLPPTLSWPVAEVGFFFSLLLLLKHSVNSSFFNTPSCAPVPAAPSFLSLAGAGRSQQQHHCLESQKTHTQPKFSLI